MKVILQIIIITMLVSSLFPQNVSDEQKSTDIIPILSYESLSFNNRTVNIPGAGLVIMSGTPDPGQTKDRNSLLFVAQYKMHLFDEPAYYDYPDLYHNIESVMQKNVKRHSYFSLFRSYSDQPVSGGLQTFAFVNGYGYELLHRNGHSLTLGASVGVSDWGIELPDGTPWPVFPLPYIHYKYDSQWLNWSFDFTTSPMIDFVLAPQHQLRLNGSMMITNMELNSTRDIKFDLSLEYRFFKNDHPMGDFAGVRIGILGEDFGYDLCGNNDESVQISWYEVYGTLDLSLLEITGGYTFSGQEQYTNENTLKLDSGYHLSVQLAYLF